jgi:hypothetical protein
MNSMSEPSSRNEQSAASIANKSILDVLPLDKAVNHIAKSLREHAEAEVWGTQEAVSKWLELLADDLDDCVKELKRLLADAQELRRVVESGEARGVL